MTFSGLLQRSFRSFCVAVTLAILAFPAIAQEKWALLIGVDEYQQGDRIPRLSGADNDAKGIYDTLVQVVGVPREHIRLLQSSKGAVKPTRGAILAELGKMKANVKPGDLVFVYYSGHGVEMNGETYLLPWDTNALNEDSFSGTAIKTKTFSDALGKVSAGTLIMAFDMCRTDPFTGGKAVQGNKMSDQMAKDLQIVPAAGGPSGVVTLYSCKTGERSWEWGEKRRGYFSYFLEEGLRGGDNGVKDAPVTVASLVNYVEKKVPEAVLREEQKPQHPWTKAEGMGVMNYVLVNKGDKPKVQPNDDDPFMIKRKRITVSQVIIGNNSYADKNYNILVLDVLTGALTNYGYFEMMDRSGLDDFLANRRTTNRSVADPATARAAGQELGLDYILACQIQDIQVMTEYDAKLDKAGDTIFDILFGTGNHSKAKVSMAVKIIDCASGLVLRECRGNADDKVYFSGRNNISRAEMEAVKKAALSALKSIGDDLGAYFPLEATVTGISKDTIVLPFGKLAGLQVGNTFTIYRIEEVIDDVTGKYLRSTRKELGTATVTEVGDTDCSTKFSPAKGVKDKPKSGNIAVLKFVLEPPKKKK